MRANIDKDGLLIPPRNVERARVRLQQLDHEIKKLADQVAGLALGAELPRAKKCLEHLNNEQAQLVRWIRDHAA